MSMAAPASAIVANPAPISLAVIGILKQRINKNTKEACLEQELFTDQIQLHQHPPDASK